MNLHREFLLSNMGSLLLLFTSCFSFMVTLQCNHV